MFNVTNTNRRFEITITADIKSAHPAGFLRMIVSGISMRMPGKRDNMTGQKEALLEAIRSALRRLHHVSQYGADMQSSRDLCIQDAKEILIEAIHKYEIENSVKEFLND